MSMVVKKPVTKKPVVRKGTEKELKSLGKKIGKVPKFFKELTVNDPDMYNLVIKTGRSHLG